ncbi:tail fiber assembly protein, partial [Plesiomonas shigelloides]|uniref:tail fiber assembly protein n=1 Tax=Plesiomonas shigelloides TaxID=703 RepID=UPI0013FC0789
RNALLQQAGERIAPLQDAVDLGMASAEETALLADLKRYRVLLSRVDTHLAPDIDWPLAP